MTDLYSDSYAQAQDAADPLREMRAQFLIPQHDGADQAYFVGNSLGLGIKIIKHFDVVTDETDRDDHNIPHTVRRQPRQHSTNVRL